MVAGDSDDATDNSTFTPPSAAFPHPPGGVEQAGFYDPFFRNTEAQRG